jgi:isopentenyl diphosphate isomerase/L-lactate dehydrogenase-like FMN-dependent dehydrogenase
MQCWRIITVRVQLLYRIMVHVNSIRHHQRYGHVCLDYSTLQIEALPRVVDALRGLCDVYMDGGVRTGGDVFKAMCLGAKAVFVGRPIIYGLAVQVFYHIVTYLIFG